METNTKQSIHSHRTGFNFYEYLESLGFFDNFTIIRTPQFFILFEIARVLYSSDASDELIHAIETLSGEETEISNRTESISVQRREQIAPISEKMELATNRTIYDLKKALPSELASDEEVLTGKLMTKSLRIRNFYESEIDRFKPIPTIPESSGNKLHRFNQKCFILLDRSRSMEFRLRALYAKCIIAEYLRKKLNSNARLYYRPFDSVPGALLKIEKKSDFPALIEQVLLTTTGGTGTNLQKAILRAITDLRYDKSLSHAEIVVITDGQSKIDAPLLRRELGSIRLNILKIGTELIAPDYYEIKKILKDNSLPDSHDTYAPHELKPEFIFSKEKDDTLSPTERWALRELNNSIETINQNLRSIARRFIQISDLDRGKLYTLSAGLISFIEDAITMIDTPQDTLNPLNDKVRRYQMLCFLLQYVDFLLEQGNTIHRDQLLKLRKKINHITEDLLRDPALLTSIIESGFLSGSKKDLESAKQKAQKGNPSSRTQDGKLTPDDIKTIQFNFSGGSARISLWLLIVRLAKKLMRYARKAVS